MSEENTNKLYVVHNLSEDKLKHVEKLGALPAPSLAVAGTETGFFNFGEISLIGNPSMANPKGRSVRVFSSDAYSPRQPRANYDLRKAGLDRMRKKLDPAATALGESFSGRLDPDDISRKGLSAFMESEIAKMAFLMDIGDAPRIRVVKKEKPDARLLKFRGSARDLMANPGFQSAALEVVRETIDGKKKGSLRDRLESVLLEERDGMVRVANNALAGYARSVVKFRGPSKPDSIAMSSAIRKKMGVTRKRREQFEAWVEDNFSDVLGKAFFVNEAGRRKDYRLDLIVHEMTRSLRDGEGFQYGLGSVRSTVSPEFRTITQIRDSRHKLTSGGRFEDLKKETDNMLFKLADSFSPYYSASGKFGWIDVMCDFLKDLGSGNPRKLAMWQEEYFSSPVPDHLLEEARGFLQHLREMPTEYFEIKMQRAVHLDEFEAAVVRRDTSKSAVEYLKSKGLKIIKYDYDYKDVGRKAAVKELPESVFFERQVEDIYSELYRGVEEAKQKSALAEDWKHIIRKMPGVKKEEIEWKMVDEWLDVHSDRQVAREDLLSYLETQDIELVETRLTEIDPETVDYTIEEGDFIPPSDEEIDQLLSDDLIVEAKRHLDNAGVEDPAEDDIRAKALELYEYINDASGQRRHVTFLPSYNDLPEYKGILNLKTRTVTLKDGKDTKASLDGIYEALKSAAIESIGSSDGEVRFEDYVEDGGTNYREILIRIPNLHKTGPNRVTLTDDQQSLWDKVNREINAVLNKPGTLDQSMLNQLERKRNALAKEFGYGKDPFVEDAHFKEENIVVHARITDREDVNGKKILFVEEIQSDIATYHRENSEDPAITSLRQQLKKEFEAIQSDLKGLTREVEALILEEFTAAFENAQIENGELKSRIKAEVIDVLLEGKSVDPKEMDNADQVGWLVDRCKEDDLAPTMERYLAANKEANEILNRILGLGTRKEADPSKPDTPLRDKAAVAFMTKYLTKMAAEEGYDKLSVTQGYMQAARWGSDTKEVFKKLGWGPSRYGTEKNVWIQMGINGEISHIFVDLDGKIKESCDVEKLVGRPLSSIVGAKIARQVLEERRGEVSVDPRSFSSTGYGVVYDQQIPSVLNKLGKKHAAQVYSDKTLKDFGAYIMTPQQMAYAPQYDEVRKAAIDCTSVEVVEDLEAYELHATKQRVQLHYHTIEKFKEDLSQTSPQSQVEIAKLKQKIEVEESKIRLEEGGLMMNRATALMAHIPEEKLAHYFPDVDRLKQAERAVWSIDLNDSLKAAVKKPLSIFERNRAPYPPIKQEALEVIEPELKNRLKALGIEGVALTSDAEVKQAGTTRIYRNGSIEVIIGQSLNPKATVDHEAIHVLRNRGLFSDAEWDAMKQQAERDWLARYNIRSRYSDFSRQTQIEEAVAHAFADYRKRPSPSGLVGRAFDKMAKLFKAVANTLTANAFLTADDVFEKVASGSIGRRHKGTNHEVCQVQPAAALYERSQVSDFLAAANQVQIQNADAKFTRYQLEDREMRIWKDGTIQFLKDGKLHSENGPALVKPNGEEVWMLDGRPASQDQLADNTTAQPLQKR